MAHPNADLVRRGFEAFAAGDMATMDALMTDDVKWHSPGPTPFSGDFDGKEAVFGSFARLGQETDSFEQDIHAILADDDHAVALVNSTTTRGGKTHAGSAVLVFHVSGGRVTEAWVTQLDPDGFRAFWAD